MVERNFGTRARQGRPKISVIVPVYNVEVFLTRCLESIINQTYTNLEIILVDDGSTERSSVICDKYSSDDPRIILIRQDNKGLSAARNAGLDICSGDYISFIDSDDWVELDMLEVLLNAIIEHSADVACCEAVRHKGRVTTYNEEVGDIRIIEGQKDILDEHICGRLSSSAWGKLFKREMFDYGHRFPKGCVYEDIRTIWKVLLICNKVVLVDRRMYHYYFRRGSITSNHTTRSLEDLWNAYDERRKGLSQVNELWNRFLIEDCLNAAAVIWSHFYPVLQDEGINIEQKKLLNNLSEFTNNYKKMIPISRFDLPHKLRILFPLLNDTKSLRASHYCYKLYCAVEEAVKILQLINHSASHV